MNANRWLVFRDTNIAASPYFTGIRALAGMMVGVGRPSLFGLGWGDLGWEGARSIEGVFPVAIWSIRFAEVGFERGTVTPGLALRVRPRRRVMVVVTKPVL